MAPTTLTTSARVLRTDEGWIVRATDRGRHELAGLSSDGLRAVTAAVELGSTREHGLPAGWVAEDDILAAAFPNDTRLRHARHRLQPIIASGHLERRREAPPKTVTYYALTEAGHAARVKEYRTRWGVVPTATRTPRPDQAIHHLLAVSAGIDILRAEGRGRDVRFLDFAGDETLRSAARSGRIMVAGQTDEKLPDGRLWFTASTAPAPLVADIEILVSKYSDAQITAKYEQLAPLGVLFFAPTRTLVDRVVALGFPAPRLIGAADPGAVAADGQGSALGIVRSHAPLSALHVPRPTKRPPRARRLVPDPAAPSPTPTGRAGRRDQATLPLELE